MNHLKATMKYLLMLSIIFCGVFVADAVAGKKSSKKPAAAAAPEPVAAAAPAPAPEPVAAAAKPADKPKVEPAAAAEPAAESTEVEPAAAEPTADAVEPAATGAAPGEPASDSANDADAFGKTWGSRPDVTATVKALHEASDQLEAFLNIIYNKYVDYTADSKLNPEIQKRRGDSLGLLMGLSKAFRDMSNSYAAAKENKDINSGLLIKVRNDFNDSYYSNLKGAGPGSGSGLGFDVMLKKRIIDIKAIDPESAKCLEELDANNTNLTEIQAKIMATKSAVIATLPQ